MKYNWEIMNNDNKWAAVAEELKLKTHMGTTKDDLVELMKFLAEQNQIDEVINLRRQVKSLEKLQQENTANLEIGTITFNALFLLCENLARNNQIADDRCQQCTKIKEHVKKYPGIPEFLVCTNCQFVRWMDAGEIMHKDPEVQAWSEANTPEKAMALIFGKPFEDNKH